MHEHDPKSQAGTSHHIRRAVPPACSAQGVPSESTGGDLDGQKESSAIRQRRSERVGASAAGRGEKCGLARELLALRCRRGDRAAWEELVAAFERPLFYYIRRMVRGSDEAWVVLQETWVRVFSSLAGLEDPRRLAPWLYSVARNAIQQRVTELARERHVPTDLEDAPDSSSDFATDHDPERIHAGLAELPLMQRDALVLFFLDDLSLQEMAEVLDVPVGTVKSRLYHARRSLERILSRVEARHER